MPCQFDELIERRGINSIKWDKAREIHGRDDLIPMWVADMDFKPPTQVIQAIERRAQSGFYGYEPTPQSYAESFQKWLAERHNWQIPPEWILHSPGVVSGLALAVQTFTQPGERILIQTPVYPPFFSVISTNGRVVVESPLKLVDGHYRMDYEHMEREFAQGARALMLCNPHNPVGRVWTRAELEKLGDLIVKYDVMVFSDEIWSDLVLPGYQHTPLAALSEEIGQRTISAMAPSKTFNLAGFYLSNVIIPCEKYREMYCQRLTNLAFSHLSSFGVVAAETAYSEGTGWLDELKNYLERNVNYALSTFKHIIPKIKIIPPEGTYLLWLDCRELGIPSEKLNGFFAKQAGVALNEGSTFGENGHGFQRMNIACPRQTLERAITQISHALSK